MYFVNKIPIIKFPNALLLLHLTTFEHAVLILNFCVNDCKWQLLYALLRLTSFVCTFSIENWCINALLQFPTFVCTTCTAIEDNFCINYCNWNIFYDNIAYYNWQHTMHYWNWPNVLLQLITFYALFKMRIFVSILQLRIRNILFCKNSIKIIRIIINYNYIINN